MKKHSRHRCLVVALLLSSAMSLYAGDDHLTGEFMPYFWGAGFKGGVNIGQRTANADVGFGDLINHVHGGFAFTSGTDYKRWVTFQQLDWFNLQADKTTSDLGSAKLRTNFVDGTVASGVRVGPMDSIYADIMAGVRITHLGNKLTTGPFPEISNNHDLIDGLFLLKPVFGLGKGFSLVIPASVGGGESDVTYDLTPQLQYAFTTNWMVSVGYRRLYYRIHSDAGRFDGFFHGGLFGVGYKFQ